MNFNFTNEQIVYLYKHFTNFLEEVEHGIEKDMKMTQGQLELYKKIFGDDERFSGEMHELFTKLITEELPEILHKRKVFVKAIVDQFAPLYELIMDAEPEIENKVINDIFGEPATTKAILEKFKNMED